MSAIIKNARTSLLLMNERGLAPTPDNYAKTYYEVSGEEYKSFVRVASSEPEPQLPPSSEVLSAQEIMDNNRKIVRYLDELTASLTNSTDDLAEKLEKKNTGIKAFIAELQEAGGKLHIVELMQPILLLIGSLQQAVRSSHIELLSTREALQEVSTELDEAKQQMLIDPLTGARNRMNMEISVGQEAARSRRNKTKLTVVMLDIDHFKKLNDQYGHDVGDKVLAHFAGIAKSMMRGIDTFFRYGGEEFLMLLPEASREGASGMLDRFRDELTRNIAAHPKNKTPLPVNFSAGVAELTDKDDVESLVARADKALYLAKERGRNRTVTDLEFEGSVALGKEESEAVTETKPVAATPKKPKPAGGVVGGKRDLGAEAFFLGRRPILHASQQLAGYELSLYAYGQAGAVEYGVAEVAGVLSDIGSEGVLQEHLGFIPITLDELMGNQTTLLSSSSHPVLELADAELDESNIAKIIELKSKGFKFSLGDYFEHPASDVVLKLLDYVKLDIQKTSQYEMTEALKRLKKIDRGAPIAINVETPKQFELSRELSIGLVEGFFFVHPEASGGGANPDQTMLLVVMGQLLTDVELPRIEKAFQGHTALITNLLSMVNSAGMGLARTVDSLQQALVILGRRHLMRWVQVLLYSNSDLKGAKMLMQMAATRAKLMDLLCTTHKDVEKRQELFKDGAFTVGILSLADVLLGIDLGDILDQIGLDEEVRQALISRKGFLGSLLLLTEKIEKAEFEAVEVLLEELGIAPKDLRRAQKETLRWVNNLGKSSNE